jgi:hypothetical protein
MELEKESVNNDGVEGEKVANKKTNTKEELIANIREWIKIDNDLMNLKKEIKNKTANKKTLTENLVKVMKSNAIDCFDINGGALVYSQKKTKKPISGKYLLLQLEKYYKEQPDMAKEVTEHLLNNREENVKEDIKRKVKK